MYKAIRHRGDVSQSLLSAILVLLLIVCFWFFGVEQVRAQDEQELPIDEAGLMALRLWEEGEREQAIAKAARLYWDYLFAQPSPYYSTFDLWFRHEQTRKWLKDPKHNLPLPLPPMPPNAFPSPPLRTSPYASQYPYAYTSPGPYPYAPQYPYPSYYPSPYSMSPYFWSPSPYYHFYRHHAKPGRKGR